MHGDRSIKPREISYILPRDGLNATQQNGSQMRETSRGVCSRSRGVENSSPSQMLVLLWSSGPVGPAAPRVEVQSSDPTNDQYGRTWSARPWITPLKRSL